MQLHVTQCCDDDRMGELYLGGGCLRWHRCAQAAAIHVHVPDGHAVAQEQAIACASTFAKTVSQRITTLPQIESPITKTPPSFMWEGCKFHFEHRDCQRFEDAR